MLALLSVIAVIGTTCIFPIDMVKTRLQASSGIYNGPLDCFRRIVAEEGGLRALYRGLIPNLIGVTPEKAIKLVGFVARIFPVRLACALAEVTSLLVCPRP